MFWCTITRSYQFHCTPVLPSPARPSILSYVLALLFHSSSRGCLILRSIWPSGRYGVFKSISFVSSIAHHRHRGRDWGVLWLYRVQNHLKLKVCGAAYIQYTTHQYRTPGIVILDDRQWTSPSHSSHYPRSGSICLKGPLVQHNFIHSSLPSFLSTCELIRHLFKRRRTLTIIFICWVRNGIVIPLYSPCEAKWNPSSRVCTWYLPIC